MLLLKWFDRGDRDVSNHDVYDRPTCSSSHHHEDNTCWLPAILAQKTPALSYPRWSIPLSEMKSTVLIPSLTRHMIVSHNDGRQDIERNRGRCTNLRAHGNRKKINSTRPCPTYYATQLLAKEPATKDPKEVIEKNNAVRSNLRALEENWKQLDSAYQTEKSKRRVSDPPPLPLPFCFRTHEALV